MTETTTIPTIWTQQEMDIIRATYSTGITPIQFELFIAVANRLRLNPLQKEIFPLPYREKAGSTEPPRLVIHISIDGYRKRASQSGEYLGTSNERFLIRRKTGEKQIVPVPEYDPEEGQIISATVAVNYRDKPPIEATALMDSYNSQKSIWLRFAPHMLLKCAEALAHRKAAPGDFAGTYAPEEMLQSISTSAPQKAIENKKPHKKEHESALELWETITEFLRAKDMTGDTDILFETALDLATSRMEVTDLADLPTERIPELAEFARTTLLHLLRDKGMIK